VSDRDPRRISLDGELTILTATELKERLLTALDGSAGLRVDLSAVDEIDTAGLQVLLVTRRAAHQANLPFEVTGPEPEIARVLAIAGLA
jgi:anti-sigma B factor antagonist